MRHRWGIAIVCVILLGLQPRPADFSGKWKLDLRTSKDLPSSFKSVQSYILSINQTADSMVVQPEMTGAGRSFSLPSTTYKFDSSEVYREDTARGSQRWIRTSWTTTGQKMIVTNRVIQKQSIIEQHYTQTDVWQFGKKGTLLILMTQKFEKSDSTHTERRYFRRVR